MKTQMCTDSQRQEDLAQRRKGRKGTLRSMGYSGPVAFPRFHLRATVFICGCLLFLTGAVQAETVVLRNGQRLRITGYERDGESLRLTIPGGVVHVRAKEIAAIEPEDYFPPPPAAPARQPVEMLVLAASAKHGVDADLILSVIAAESNFDPKAVSRKGAQGLMQLMPSTAQRFEVQDVFDPAQNIEAGTQYLKELLAKYNQDVRLALAAYNAGPESVERHRGVPPFAETRGYLERVMKRFHARKQKRD
jgi:hypothetical protein